MNRGSSMINIAEILKSGGIGVMPTDTIYGLVGSALSKKTVLRIYKVRQRDLRKPFIVLIGSLGDLKKFGVKLNPRHLAFLRKIWPGPVSVILPCTGREFYYLHRGTRSLAFRLPKDKGLINLLKKTGPLVAPSANIARRRKKSRKRKNISAGGWIFI